MAGKDLNKVQLIGRLGADPEARFTAGGTAITNFRVATSRSWKDAGGQQQEQTEWTQVVAWDKLGEICNQYLAKGSRVYIEGRLQTRKWQGKDGNDRYTTEVVASDMIMLDGKKDGERSAAEWPAPASKPARNVPQAIDGMEDLPF